MGPEASPSDGPTAAEESAALDELRRLLLEPERDQIAEIREVIQDPVRHAAAVGEVLTEAIRYASQKDKRLGRALAPTIESALRESVERDPAPLADAIFPIIGPAIRRSIAAMFRELTQSFNRTLEHSLSFQGLRWRWEGWRTGRSFAEVVVARTLVYRVEQVLLIHNESSLLLAEVHAVRTEIRDADQVSAMLAAIQDFMRDSFRTDHGDGLNTVEYGELTLWLAHGPRATLVAAIRGHAPETLRALLQQVTEDIHRGHAQALAGFAGDNVALTTAARDLEQCLVEQHGGPAGQPLAGTPSSAKLWALVSVILVTLIVWCVWSWRETRAWRRFQAELTHSEGIVVTDVSRSGGVWTFLGLRDPLAAAPKELLQRHGLPLERAVFHLTPFWSLMPEMVVRRAIQRLAPPPGVSLRLDGERLVAEGYAPAAWIELARASALGLPGVVSLDTTRVLDSSQRALAEAVQRVENQVIYFAEADAFVPDAAAGLDQLATEIQKLQAAAAGQNQELTVELRGHASRSGTSKTNQRVGLLRAQAVANALKDRGVASRGIHPISRGDSDAQFEIANPKDQRVTVRVELPGPKN